MKTLTVLLICIAPLTVRAEPPKATAKAAPASVKKVVAVPVVVKPVVPKLPIVVPREVALTIQNAQLKMQLDEAQFWMVVEKYGREYQFDVSAGDDVNFQTGVITRGARGPVKPPMPAPPSK